MQMQHSMSEPLAQSPVRPLGRQGRVGSSGGLNLLGETAPDSMRRSPQQAFSAYEHEMAQEGMRTGTTIEALPTAEADFLADVTVRGYVKYFMKSVLNYDSEAIIGPGVFYAATTRASILARKQLLRDMFIVLGISASIAVSLRWWKVEFEQEDIERLGTLVKDFQSLCTFLLGFFVSTCLTRWWSIRNDCIGKLWGCADDISLIVGAYFGRDTAEDREVRETVLRWCLLSHELVYKQAQAQDDMSDLVDRGFMSEAERDLLAQQVSKPQVIWGWMCSYFAHLAYGDPQQGGSRLPYPMTVLPQLHELSRNARGAIGALFAYTDTQVPFRYVHFLALIIWMNNMFQAVNSAVVISQADLPKQMTGTAVEIVFLVFHPLIYFGLLQLGCGMLNPVRSQRDTDFPAGAWTYFMHAEIKSLLSAKPYGAPPVWDPCSSPGASLVSSMARLGQLPEKRL